MATAVRPDARRAAYAAQRSAERAADRTAAVARAARMEARIIRATFKPPERLTVSEWADKYRWLPDTSAIPGKYQSKSAPYQREPMDVCGHPMTKKVAMMFGSQLGKSLILENVVGCAIHLRPRPMIIVQPKIDSAEAWSKERFGPMVQATPVLRARVRLGRTRDGENTLRYKRFDGGFAAIASANSPAELAARSCALQGCDEIDRYPQSSGSEGNPIRIVERRGGAIADARQILTSSPGDEKTSRIKPAFREGDQRFFYVPCPHCQHEQTLRFQANRDELGEERGEVRGGLHWTKDDETGRFVLGTAHYVCEECGCEIEEKWKSWMLERGRWIATHPGGRYPSFHLNALYSPFGGTTWQEIVEQFESAQGKPLDLKQFVNTILAQTWKEMGEEVNPDLLADRIERFPEDGRVPAGVGVITAGTDVQGDRLERRVWGWGAGRESWLLRVDVISGDPGSAVLWRQWDEIRREPFVHVSGRRLSVAREFVDAGDGNQSGTVYEVCRRRRHEGVYACRGISGVARPLAGKPVVQGKVRALVYPVGVDTGKSLFILSQLREGRPGPGYVHLPDAPWCDEEELAQMVAERFERKYVPGKGWQKKWVSTRDRNEALDCRNYAAAALESLGIGVLKDLGHLAKHAAAEPPPTPVAVAALIAAAAPAGVTTIVQAPAAAEGDAPLPVMEETAVRPVVTVAPGPRRPASRRGVRGRGYER